MELTVVLCTVGRAPTLPGAVASLLAQPDPDLQVLVVDNSPETGDVRQALRSFEDPRLRIVAEDGRGLSRARNRGIAEARSELLAFTDDDVEVDASWASSLRAVFEADVAGEVACVTGRVLAASAASDAHRWFEQGFGFDKGGAPLVWHATTPDGGALREALDAVLPGIAPGPQGPVFPIAGGEFGSGNAMAFRRAWFVDHGGFDEALGAGTATRGGEDLDIFRRVVLSGHALAYAPTAVARHHHRADLRALTIQAYGYGTGMAASVTRHVLTGSAACRATVRMIPSAAAILLRPSSTKNARKPMDYPRRLDAAERAGYLLGPLLALAGTARAGGPAAARRIPFDRG